MINGRSPRRKRVNAVRGNPAKMTPIKGAKAERKRKKKEEKIEREKKEEKSLYVAKWKTLSGRTPGKPPNWELGVWEIREIGRPRRMGDSGDWEIREIGEFGKTVDTGHSEIRKIGRCGGFGSLEDAGDSGVTKDWSSGDWRIREIGKFGDYKLEDFGKKTTEEGRKKRKKKKEEE